MIALAHGADLVGAAALLAGSTLIGLINIRGRHRQLERGRRTYPCSHGAAGTGRWGYTRHRN